MLYNKKKSIWEFFLWSGPPKSLQKGLFLPSSASPMATKAHDASSLSLVPYLAHQSAYKATQASRSSKTQDGLPRRRPWQPSRRGDRLDDGLLLLGPRGRSP